MKAVPAAHLLQARAGSAAFAWAIRIVRTDGLVLGFTTSDRSETISGTLYRSNPGMSVASLVSSSGFAVDNTEATMLADGVYFLREDMLAGRWDGAAFELFRYDVLDPSSGRDVRKVGTFGALRPRREEFVCELRGLRQRLQAAVGNVTQPSCRNRLGDSRCGIDLDGSPGWKSSGTITSVTSQLIFRDSALSRAADFFSMGRVRFVSGDNAGLSFRVLSSDADGTFTLVAPTAFQIGVGDAYEATAGCRGRRTEDCAAKFNNAINFYGEPDLPGLDQIVAPAST